VDDKLKKRKRLKMTKFTKSILLVFLLALSAAAFGGCRTAHGFGEDMEQAGHEIQKGTQ